MKSLNNVSKSVLDFKAHPARVGLSYVVPSRSVVLCGQGLSNCVYLWSACTSRAAISVFAPAFAWHVMRMCFRLEAM